MSFDEKTWKSRIAESLRNVRRDMEQFGVHWLYGFLSTMTLWPVAEAIRGGDFSALVALGGVAGGVGGNLLANLIQSWKDKTQTEAAQAIDEKVASDPELRAVLDDVLEKLGTVPAVAASLNAEDRNWFQDTLRRQLSELGNLQRFEAHLVGDGAVAQGPRAKAAGKQGVVADRIDAPVQTGDRARMTYIREQKVVAPRQPSRQDKEKEAEIRFLTRCCRLWNAVPLAVLGGEQAPGRQIRLEQVYVQLDTTTRVPLPKEEAKPRRPSVRNPLDDREHRLLTAMEAAAATPQLILLGDPGGGKSAFVRQLAAQLARVRCGEAEPPAGFEKGIFPLIVDLRDLAPSVAAAQEESSAKQRSRLLVDALRAQWRRQLEDLESLDFESRLETLLDRGEILAVFDGLDEVAENLREDVRRMIAAALEQYAGIQRTIVTCRVRSYTTRTLFSGFDEHTLALLDEPKIRRFVGLWYDAQSGQMGPAKAESKKQDLEKAVLTGDLRELASNPMLLTTMAIIHQREVGLPRERVRLYEEAVEILLRRWQEEREIQVSDRLAALLDDRLKLRRVIEDLAYLAHRSQSEGDKEGLLLRGDLLTFLEREEQLGKADTAADFLDYVDHRAGLLVGRGGDAAGALPQAYSFPHRTFQEYLAGCRMARGRRAVREFRSRAEDGDFWSLAAQLGAEEVLFVRKDLEAALDLAYQLCLRDKPGAEQDWRSSLWSGQIAAVVGVQEVARDDSPDGGTAYLRRIRSRLLEVMRESPLGPLERIEAGRALARLGDPRAEVLEAAKTEFLEIPAGKFWMGSGDHEPGVEKREKPLHELDIPYHYRIARFPVTNAQFGEFVAAGGYREAAYWKEAERAELWRDGRIKLWTWDPIKMDGYEDWWAAARDYGEPLNLANHPVVGVSWYEALAYARWLTDLLHDTDKLDEDWRVVLPSEAEWEKAARGGEDAQVFPWGDGFDENHCNGENTKSESGNAVGCFPMGASPFQVEELSGNVWEWTRSLWGESFVEPTYGYRYRPRDGREKLDAKPSIRRIIRGGCFLNGESYLRCAARYGNHPGSRSNDLGFRVAASPFVL